VFVLLYRTTPMLGFGGRVGVQRFDNARIREFVGGFVERRLRAELRALVQM